MPNKAAVRLAPRSATLNQDRACGTSIGDMKDRLDGFLAQHPLQAWHSQKRGCAAGCSDGRSARALNFSMIQTYNYQNNDAYATGGRECHVQPVARLSGQTVWQGIAYLGEPPRRPESCDI